MESCQKRNTNQLLLSMNAFVVQLFNNSNNKVVDNKQAVFETTNNKIINVYY